MRKIFIVVFLVMLAAGNSYAAGPWNDSLSRLGSEQAGNASGTIPQWTGGLTTVPQNYQKGGFHPDPFAEDQLLFKITHENWMQYKSELTAGQQMMLQKYPDFYIPVYPTRRSASYPEYVYEAIRKNAGLSQLAHDGAAVKGGGIAIPFPVPENGLEAIWNHLLRFRGQQLQRHVAEVVVTSKDRFVTTTVLEKIMFRYSEMGASFDSSENILAYFKQHFRSPARRAGVLFLVHETVDKAKELRRSWLYNPGLRRVIRAPFTTYDSYPPTGEGLRTFDQYDLFNGAIDRYDWTLEGKQEFYVPYNSYRLASEKFDEKKVLSTHFINPEMTRYELHRVWKVSAVLKPGKSHIYAKRVFYFDEDSWQILISEEYDGKGDLWRLSEGHAINFYEVPLIFTAAETHYDLKSGQYIVMQLQIEPFDFSVKLNPDDFTPDALRREGNR